MVLTCCAGGFVQLQDITCLEKMHVEAFEQTTISIVLLMQSFQQEVIFGKLYMLAKL